MRRTWGALAAMLVGLWAAPPAGADELVTRTFGWTGTEQTFVVPAGVASMQVRALGGRGAGGSRAAEAIGELSVTPGQTLYIEVAGDGSGGQGGFNGGGAGGSEAQGGGGGSDVRTAPRSAGLSPDPRLIVAGGGGGGGDSGSAGGAAGEPGERGHWAEGGQPGSATEGGRGGEVEECTLFGFRPGEARPGGNGQRGAGGAGASCNSQNHGAAGGGGGGGGYYGGGGGNAFYEYECSCAGHYFDGAGGGGGSSLAPAEGTVALASAASEPVVQLTFEQPENPPAVTTGASSSLLAHSATVGGTVNPEESTVTTCEFEYGTTVFYGESAPCSAAPGAGYTPVPVTAALTGLSASTTYHYRVVAANGLGTSYGADRELVTRPHEAPTVSELAPTLGPSLGGQSVTFVGSELQHVAAVEFGNVPAAEYTIVSPTELTAVTPGDFGVGPASVTLVDDLRDEAPAGVYRFVAQPVLQKLSVKKGPPAGGTTVTLSGSFDFATEVLFGSAPATIVSDTGQALTVVTPAHASGKYGVRVIGPGGETGESSKAVFEFERPTVSAVSPASGPLAGGTTVTVTGAGFALGAGTAFKFGKAAATAVECASSTSCTLLVPAAKQPGAVDVLAAVGRSKGRKSPPGDRFTYE